MRLATLPLVLLLASTVSTVSTAPIRGEDVRSFSRAFEAADLESVMLDFPVGEVEVEGTGGDRVEIDIVFACKTSGWGSSTCRDRADEIELESQTRGSQLRLNLDGYGTIRHRGLTIRLHARVPRDLDFELDMGIGEASLKNLEGNVTVDLGIGEVGLALQEEMVGSVRLDNGIGETSLRTTRDRKEHAGLFVGELTWAQGNGDSRIQVDLGIGEITVRLQ